MNEKINPIPEGYHSITPNLVMRNAKSAIEYYKNAFDAELIFSQERNNGKIMHATMKIGDSIIMMADECAPHASHEEQCVKSPSELKNTTVNLYLYVTDADKAFKKAINEGGTIIMDITNMFWGDRIGIIKDPYGHLWTIAAKVEEVPPKELRQRTEEFLSHQISA